MTGMLNHVNNPVAAEWVVNGFLQSLCIGAAGYIAVRLVARKRGHVQGVLLFAILGAAVLSLVGGAVFQITGQSIATIPLRGEAAARELAKERPAFPAPIETIVRADVPLEPPARDVVAPSAEAEASPMDASAPLRWGVIAFNVAGLAWLIGIGVCLFRMAAAAVLLRRLRRQLPLLTGSRVRRIWRRVSSDGGGAAKRARLLTGPPGGSPFAFGSISPVVVVPRDFESTLPERDIEAALAHEWAHVRNGDLVLGVAQRLVVSLHWWNPLLRSISSTLSLQREIVCDSSAASQVGDAGTYARSLVNLAERTCRRNPMAGSMAMVDASHSLETRLKTLTTTKETMHTRPGTMHTIAIYSVVIALAGLTSGLRATFAQDAAEDESPREKQSAEAVSGFADEAGRTERAESRAEEQGAKEARAVSRAARRAIEEAREETKALRREIDELRAQLELSRDEAKRVQQLADVQAVQAERLEAARLEMLKAAEYEALASAEKARVHADRERQAVENQFQAQRDQALSFLQQFIGESDNDVEKEIEKKSREFAGLINDFVKQVIERATLEVEKQVEEIQRQMENEAKKDAEDAFEREAIPEEEDPAARETLGNNVLEEIRR